MLFGVGKLGAARRSADVDFILRMTISAAEVTSGDTSNDDTLSLTFTANAATSNFVAGDITVTNGTISSFSGSGTTYTATFTPTADGATTVQVLADKFTDASANSNVASDVFNWTYDSTSPTMTITAAEVSDGDSSDDDTLSLTFTSSESTTDFTANDITVSNGTISSFSGSGTSYTATFTPTAQGATTIQVLAGAFTDAQANSNLASDVFNWTYDTVPPTMTITAAEVSDGGTSGDSTLSLTFTSSESTTNFVAGDITVTNGTISSFAGSGATYTATFTPTAEGATTIDVAAGVYTDAAGNNNLAATQFNWTYSPVVGDVSASILVVGGGGGGGKRHGGGGGAGGLVLADVTQLSSGTTYTVTVGAGGAGGGTGSFPTKAANGTNSTFFGFTALGGGGGSSFDGSPDDLASDGGSGGGAAKGADETGASGTQPSQSQPYTTIHNAGNDGGDATVSAGSPQFPGAGGGGAGAAGQDTSASVTGGDGGDGLQVSIEHVSNGVTVTANGNAQISTAQSKFGGASAYFDGGDDNLNVAYSPNWNFTSGQTLTMEMWINVTNFSVNRHIASKRQSGLTGWVFVTNTSGDLVFVGWDTNATTVEIKSSNTASGMISANTWHHVAVVLDSGTYTLYLDGTAVDSQTGLLANELGTNTSALSIGRYANQSRDFLGYIDEFRISNTARYTANFTPTTSAFTDDSNTLLLLHMDGDNASTTFNNDAKHRLPVAVSAVGNAQVSTAQSQFGGASALFDGTGDYLSIPIPSFGEIGTGDFTIECFARSTAGTSNEGFFALSDSLFGEFNSYALGHTSNWNFYRGTNSNLSILGYNKNNTWFHIAIVRNSGTLDFYIDGTSLSSSSDTTNVSAFDTLAIGGYYSSSYLLTGNIDEFRVSNTARYTAAFTPQRSAFENDANTLLLLHMDGTNGSTSFPDDNSGFYYAGGGGGAGHKTIASIFGAGGLGGGSAGTANDDEPSDATPNTGGGGGGARSDPDTLLIEGGDGGSGIVVIRTTSTATATTGSPTVATDGSDNIYKYTGSGSITF